MAANHSSHLDIPIISVITRRHVAFVARDTLDGARWLSFVMRECRTVLIRRGTADRRAIRAMVEHLEAGDCVAIYPEGTRRAKGRKKRPPQRYTFKIDDAMPLHDSAAAATPRLPSVKS